MNVMASLLKYKYTHIHINIYKIYVYVYILYSCNIPSSHGNLAPASGVEANRLYIRGAGEGRGPRERISRLNTRAGELPPGACPVAGITLTPR